MTDFIPFNKPYKAGREFEYISEAINRGHLSGDGYFTRKCQSWFEQTYKFNKTLLTTSCTDALEMCALLTNTNPGDEIIAPSYTFVSTVNAFVLRGAKIIFADSSPLHPNIDETQIEKLITPKTKAIVVVHYAGVACNMNPVLDLARKYNLYVIEDASQAVDSFYYDKPLGGIGDMAAFSFHETKNIICGEGGMIVINNKQFEKRAEIIREKGTNRSSFFRGEVDKYGWVDVGSSFLPSELLAAYLYAQIEEITDIQKKRMHIWKKYFDGLASLVQSEKIKFPFMPTYATNNAHMFYIECRNLDERTALVKYLKSQNILAVFHYLSLHKSPYYASQYNGDDLPNADRFTDCILRLPLYYELTDSQLEYIIHHIHVFFNDN